MNSAIERFSQNSSFESFNFDVFDDWEKCKDEILPRDLKEGTGNGTIHVYLGQASDESHAYKNLAELYPNYLEGFNEDQIPRVKHFIENKNLLQLIFECLHYRSKVGKAGKYDLSEKTSIVLNDPNDEYFTFESELKVSENRFYFKNFCESFKNAIRASFFKEVSYKISFFKNPEGEACAFWQITSSSWFKKIEPSFNLVEESQETYGSEDKTAFEIGKNLIYFGPPGTGKSHRANQEISKAGAESTKTLFHPDYTYGDFFGTYRPVVGSDPSSTNFKNLEGQEGLPMPVNYFEFVPGPFMKAITNSLQDQTKPHYLLIDEINRGDCSAIFGDVFQLLDRKEDGSSEYGVELRPEAAEWLGEKVANWDEAEKGKLRIPGNLSILGTMNTSDQNLYPMDTAFKRRWEWESCSVEAEYEEFKKKFSNALLNDGKKKWDWLALIEKLNSLITNESNMEDKQIGPWFLKPNGAGAVCRKAFSNKLLFYLWFDVFKDEQDSPNSPFDLNDDIRTFGQLQEEFDKNGLEGIFEFGVLVATHSQKNEKGLLPELAFADDMQKISPNNEEGEVLDCKFSITTLNSNSVLIYHSAGQGLNSDYNNGLELILKRLGTMAFEMENIYLDSRTAKSVEINKLLFKLDGWNSTVQLSKIDDFNELRKDISRQSARTLQTEGSTSLGNGQKTIRIILNALPIGGISSLEELRDYLVTGKSDSSE